MESISKVAVSMFAGENDKLCPPIRAFGQAERISTMANFVTILDRGHGVAAPGDTFF